MANYCSNTLMLSGRYKAFAKRIENHNYNDCGYLIGEMALFDLYKSDEGIYMFESKWTPPIDDLVAKAKKSGFSFTLEYYEPGCQIYGKAEYSKESGLSVYDLPESVFDRVSWDDECNEMKIDGSLEHACGYEEEFYEDELNKMINNGQL
jgi:hypothetical protein